MKKLDNTKVSEDTPKLGLESGDQNATATAVVNPVDETAATVETQSGDQNATATAVVNPETDKAEQEENEKVWIRVLLPLAGKFLMPHDPGAEFEIDKNQGEVIVEAAYAEYLTAEEIAAK